MAAGDRVGDDQRGRCEADGDIAFAHGAGKPGCRMRMGVRGAHTTSSIKYVDVDDFHPKDASHDCMTGLVIRELSALSFLHQISNLTLHHLSLTTGRKPEGVIVPTDEDRAYVSALIDRLWKETDVLVNQNWSAIKRVAQALKTRDLLSQEELDELILK
jgi:hypothetical protein